MSADIMATRSPLRGALFTAAAAFLLFFCFRPGSPAAESPDRFNSSGVELFRAGRFDEALVKFEAAVKADPGFEQARHNLAHTHGSLGRLRIEAGDLAGAADHLEEALEILPDESGFHQLLAYVYFRRGDLYLALRSAEEAAELDEGNAGARELIGDIHYQEGLHSRALAAWEGALSLTGGNRERISAKIERIRREMDAEGGFGREVSVHFTLQYDEPLPRGVPGAILREMESLYDEIGRELGSYPRGDIPVILYSRVLFSEITESPVWVAGTFDGKIRIPAGGISSEHDVSRLRPVLSHELAHAFIRNIASRGLPLWFEEGLAEHFEGVPTDTVISRVRSRGMELPSSFSSVNTGLRGKGSSVGSAYISALLAVRFIEERSGFWSIRRTVEAVGRGTSFEEALRDEARLEQAELEEKWRSSLP